HRSGAEHRAHDLLSEIIAREHSIERHHAAVREAEYRRDRVELAQPLREHEAPRGERLHEKTGDQHALRAIAIAHQTEYDSSTEARKPFEAVDGDGGDCRNPASQRIADGVENRAGVRGAASE